MVSLNCSELKFNFDLVCFLLFRCTVFFFSLMERNEGKQRNFDWQQRHFGFIVEFIKQDWNFPFAALLLGPRWMRSRRTRDQTTKRIFDNWVSCWTDISLEEQFRIINIGDFRLSSFAFELILQVDYHGEGMLIFAPTNYWNLCLETFLTLPPSSATSGRC